MNKTTGAFIVAGLAAGGWITTLAARDTITAEGYFAPSVQVNVVCAEGTNYITYKETDPVHHVFEISCMARAQASSLLLACPTSLPADINSEGSWGQPAFAFDCHSGPGPSATAERSSLPSVMEIRLSVGCDSRQDLFLQYKDYTDANQEKHRSNYVFCPRHPKMERFTWDESEKSESHEEFLRQWLKMLTGPKMGDRAVAGLFCPYLTSYPLPTSELPSRQAQRTFITYRLCS